jgi:hypothetical protein
MFTPLFTQIMMFLAVTLSGVYIVKQHRSCTLGGVKICGWKWALGAGAALVLGLFFGPY